MSHTRRALLYLGAGAAMLPAAASHRAFALDYPTRPVRLVVGFAASGGTDIAARVTGNGCR